jgi:hypothetical protein
MRDRDKEPMCQTSEKGEKLIQRQDMLPIALEVGRRIMEVFGYQQISNIVFRLKSSHDEIDSVINGNSLPTTELLRGIHRVTGASIDWLLTGQGTKYMNVLQIVDNPSSEPIAPAMWFAGEENERTGQLL